MPQRKRTWSIATAAILSCALAMLSASTASASRQQVAMFADNGSILTDPIHTLGTLREIGVQGVRLGVSWSLAAPQSISRRRPANFRASDPKSYPDRIWGQLDAAIATAIGDGLTVNLDISGPPPLWASGPGAPPGKHPNWEPSASEYGQFLTAVATRYGGNYNPKKHKLMRGNPDDLPAVHSWSVWNEPDYGPSLAPQGLPSTPTVEHSPWMYRGLLDAAWSVLQKTGHGHDTVLFGELAPRGVPNAQSPKASWGLFSGMKPLVFVRALYCVDAHYHPLKGTVAALRGCPTNAAGSRGFAAAHPALFKASGFADHPYSRWYPPNVEANPDPDYSSLAEIGGLERALNRVQAAYGSSWQVPIWNTEYGYLTSPPKRSPDPNNKVLFVSPVTAAYYLNWAEYISWRDPRIMSTMQYLLRDPLPAIKTNDWGGFASGLVTFGGRAKDPTYNAYRMPLYLPVMTARRGQSLEVWGCVRPAPAARFDTGKPQVVQIQFQPASGGQFTTVRSVTITDPHGYFDARVPFPSSGTVRITWTYPTDDPQLYSGLQAYSRHVQITLK